MKAGRPDSTALNNGCLGFWPLDGKAGETTAADLMGARDLTIARSPTYIDYTTANDFPTYAIGDGKIYVPIHRLYPTNLVDVTIGAGASVKDDMFEKDTKVTFTATAKDSSVQFVRWYGDVAEADAMSPTIEVLADQAKTVLPYFAFKWTYDGEAKTISDNYWTISATLANETEITTGKPKGRLPLPLLDFSKDIVTTTDDACTLVTIGGGDVNTGAFAAITDFRELRLPSTLKTLKSTTSVNWARNAFKECSGLVKVSPFLVDSLEVIEVEAFNGCSSLLGELTLGGGKNECILRETTNSEFGKTVTRGSQFANTKITGLKVCNTVHSLPHSVFNNCSMLTNVVFEKGSVTNISKNVFASCKGVKTFVMGERPIGIDDTAFSGWTSNQCRFVIHAVDPGWAAYMSDAANFIAWESLDAATKAGYKAKFVGARAPLGLSRTLPANQWLCSDTASGLTLLLR